MIKLFSNVKIIILSVDIYYGGGIMKIDTSMMTYKKTVHYQEKFKEFEKILSDKRKENPENREMYEILKKGMTPEQRENSSYEDFTFKFCYRDSQAVFSNAFGEASRANYTYTNSNSFENGLSITPEMSIPTKYGINLRVNENSVSWTPGSNPLSDEESSELNSLAYGLNRLIRYANGQNGSPHLEPDIEKSILKIFNSMGIRTNDAFIINGTEFNTLEHDKLEKSGVHECGFSGLPDYMMKKLFNAYGSELGIDLNWDDDAFIIK